MCEIVLSIWIVNLFIQSCMKKFTIFVENELNIPKQLEGAKSTLNCSLLSYILGTLRLVNGEDNNI